MSDELKPCPLCGSEAMLIPADDESPAEVYCSCCWCSVIKSDTAGAIATWNARAAVDDEQFATVARDGDAWQKVRTCHMSMCDEDDDDLPAYYRSYKCDACGKTHARYKGDDYDYCPRCGAKVTNEEEVG